MEMELSSLRSVIGSTKSKHRFETSLGQLTRRFIELLKESQDGVLNLNTASSMLNVQKRRIYDITNVLEGVGLLNKTSKNNIKWNGGSLDSCLDNPSMGSLSNLADCSKVGSKADLERENASLDEKERSLDDAIKKLMIDLQKTTEDEENKKHLYVTYRDMRCIREWSKQTVIAMKAPPETKVEVSDPSESLQIHVKSDRGPIEVYLCPEDDDVYNSEDIKSEPTSNDHEPQVTVKTETKDISTEADIESGIGNTVPSESDELDPRSYLRAIEDHTYGKMKSVSSYGAMSSSTSGHYMSSPNNLRSLSSSVGDVNFLPLEPPLSEEDYNFALEESEGLTDLFDEMLPCEITKSPSTR